MKTYIKLLLAISAIAAFASNANAQQPARRNSSAASRQENKVERQHNDSNQNATAMNARESWSSGSSSGVRKPSGNAGVSSGGAKHPAGNGSSNGGNFGGKNGYGSSNGGNFGGKNGNGSGGSKGHDYNAPRPPKDGRGIDEARRPKLAPVIEYNRTQVYERNNAASIVVNTTFRSKYEAYKYIERLLDERYYSVSSFGNGYNWMLSDVFFIPTPFAWTNPMAHNQFRMRFDISSGFSGLVKVTVTAEWRESVLSDSFNRLRFESRNSYSTYYAWNVLEDIAAYIPHGSIYFR